MPLNLAVLLGTRFPTRIFWGGAVVLGMFFLTANGWAICPDPNKPNCEDTQQILPPPEVDPVPPVRFQPDILNQEIQRAFTVGNPPTGKVIPEPVIAPAFVDESPVFNDGDYPLCGNDGVNAICH